MATVTVNTSGLRRAQRYAEQRAPAAHRMMVQEVLTLAWGVFGPLARRDTNRFANGWAQAVKQVGGKAQTRPVEKGKFRLLVAERLEHQRKELAKIIGRLTNYIKRLQYIEYQWYTRRGRNDRWAKKIRRKIELMIAKREKLFTFRDKVEKELEGLSTEGAIGFFGGSGRRLSGTARVRVYGGQGSWLMNRAGLATARIHNLEAHTSLVEKRYGLSFPGLVRQVTGGSKMGVVAFRGLKIMLPSHARK